jgi:hypothetical protein
MWGWLWACGGDGGAPRDREAPDGAPDHSAEAEPTAPGPVPVSLSVEGLPGLAGGGRLTFDGPPGPVEVACVGGGETWRHVAPGPGAWSWYGLLADTDHTCTATAGAASATATHHTPPWPDDVPTFSVTGRTDAFTLLVVKDQVSERSQLLLVDPLGRPRWRSLAPDGFNVGVEAAYLPDTAQGPRFLIGGGDGLPPTLVGWDGAIGWQAGPTTGGGAWHHDVLALPDGTLAALGEVLLSGGAVSGFTVEALVPGTDERSFTWSCETALARGQLAPPAGEDPWHANALEWHPEDPEGASWWVSAKNASQIYRVDAATGDLTWRLGPGGDFQLLRPDGAPASDDRWFYGQHAPEAHLQPDGTWLVTVYDNGGSRPTGRYSRVVQLVVDPAARTARLGWEWRGEGWYEPVFGDVDALADGSLLVTRGHCPQCAGVAPIPGAVTRLHPATSFVAWELTVGTADHSQYRAAAVDSCALFPDNDVACPPVR